MSLSCSVPSKVKTGIIQGLRRYIPSPAICQALFELWLIMITTKRFHDVSTWAPSNFKQTCEPSFSFLFFLPSSIIILEPNYYMFRPALEFKRCLCGTFCGSMGTAWTDHLTRQHLESESRSCAKVCRNFPKKDYLTLFHCDDTFFL
jgi:hypothetical protein